MKEEFEISYNAPGTIPLKDLTYVIVGTREAGRWIFVRHKDRKSWELPAGHIEADESAEEAARRELFEETGTISAEIRAIHDYSVTTNGETRHGRLFLARVLEREALPDSEIAEIRIQEISPEPATYPEAHRSFLEVLEGIVSA